MYIVAVTGLGLGDPGLGQRFHKMAVVSWLQQGLVWLCPYIL
jgi:hypothetical protein